MHLDSLTMTLEKGCFEYILDLEVKKSMRYLYFFYLLIVQPDKSFEGMDDHSVKAFAKIMKDEIRGTDVIGRIGKDKFFIILHQCDVQNGISISQRILTRVSNYSFLVDQKEKKIPVSVGGACFPSHANDLENLIKTGEDMLIKAREEGGNKVCVPTMDFD